MRTLIAFDQLLNVIIFNGDPDETLSARSYRLRETPFWGKMQIFLDRIFFWQKSHCQQCYEWEQARLDMPSEYQV